MPCFKRKGTRQPRQISPKGKCLQTFKYDFQACVFFVGSDSKTTFRQLRLLYRLVFFKQRVLPLCFFNTTVREPHVHCNKPYSQQRWRLREKTICAPRAYSKKGKEYCFHTPFFLLSNCFAVNRAKAVNIIKSTQCTPMYLPPSLKTEIIVVPNPITLRTNINIKRNLSIIIKFNFS